MKFNIKKYKWLLIAAAAIGAYFLYKKFKSSQSLPPIPSTTINDVAATCKGQANFGQCIQLIMNSKYPNLSPTEQYAVNSALLANYNNPLASGPSLLNAQAPTPYPPGTPNLNLVTDQM
jgi:hypothetical protein